MHNINQLKKLRFHHLAVLLLVSVYALITVGCGAIQLVSKASDGTPGNNSSYNPAISGDGRFVAFKSRASNLVPNDTYGFNIFVRDRTSRTTECVSVDSNGNDRGGKQPSISADGRYVAFVSDSTNLAGGDTNNASDIFVRDRTRQTTEPASKDSNGNQGNADSEWPSISADGRYVAFESDAANLDGRDMNVASDIFVYDRISHITELVSKDSNGNQGNNASRRPSISASGRYVAFESDATNLAGSDMNNASDIFIHDRISHITAPVSKDSNGNLGNADSERPSISADGRYVAFESKASNLVPNETSGTDVFIHDRISLTTERISEDSNGNRGGGRHPSISADGRYVAFVSGAVNLAPNCTHAAFDDILVYDRINHTTECITLDNSGNEGDDESGFPVISADGRFVAFYSYAENFVLYTIAHENIFIRDRDYNP